MFEAQAPPLGALQRPEPLHTRGPAHSLSGSAPEVMAPQTPLLPDPFFAALHASHVFEQALLQQNPSTQATL